MIHIRSPPPHLIKAAVYCHSYYFSRPFVFHSLVSLPAVEHFMEVTRNLGTMNVLGDDDDDKSRPPLRQNTFVIEDRNVMRLGGGAAGNGEDRLNGNRVSKDRSEGQKTNGARAMTKKPPTMPLAKSNAKTVITSKTNSGLRDDGECGIPTGTIIHCFFFFFNSPVQ